MPDSLTITIPLPPKELSPNARVHWAAKSRKVKAYRKNAFAAAYTEVYQAPPKWKEAKARATFYWPDKRRRDKDNAQAALKAAFDGIVDADVLTDDAGLTHMPTRFEVDKHRPRVVIEIEPHPNGDNGNEG